MNSLAIIGFGGVGRELARQAAPFFQINLVADRSGFIAQTFTAEQLEACCNAKAQGSALAAQPGGQQGHWIDELATGTLVADTTADETGPLLIQCIERGHQLALANKKPLTGAFEQFKALTGAGKTRHEATVGAGLPVVITTRMVCDSGDQVQRIEGCLSGTLAFLLSELQAGRSFAETVRIAQERGWTEPDPRDDLGGIDVARKALILARVSGYQFELSDVNVEPLFPDEMAEGSVEDFLALLPELDQEMAQRQAGAARHGRTLRYVATVTPDGIDVGLREVAQTSPLGSLQGADNMITWTTRRYAERPLVVRGPGAGIEVTAGAVLFDLLALSERG